MNDYPNWKVDGRDWPNREASQFVEAGGTRWHVQIAGDGPVLLLVHGTGAATHSWRGLLPLLASRFTVVAPDLPGHGFTEPLPPHRMSMPEMARGLGALLKEAGVSPVIAAGHSAGAAIAVRMTLDELMTPNALVSLNGALLPLRGAAQYLFLPAARLLSVTSLPSRFFAWRAGNRQVAERLLSGTGSRIDREGVEFYRRIISRAGHVASALDMMANWDLDEFENLLPALDVPLNLINGSRDRTIPKSNHQRAARVVANSSIIELPGLGHLAHEEAPEQVADLIQDVANKIGLG